MTTLTLALPLSKPTVATEFDYVLSADGHSIRDHGTAPLALLPRADSMVLVVPARALSWHKVRLPPVAAGRLRAALDGLLEDHLLDDPAQFALALVPQRLANGDALVVALDKSWLHAALEFFEQEKRPANRVVAEFAPDGLQGDAGRLYVIGSAHDASLVVVQAQGVTCLPLASASAAFSSRAIASGDGDVQAEPSVAELAEQVLGRAVVVRGVAQGLLEAGRCEWELAQFELSISGGGRLARRWQQRGRQIWQVPAWRAARWGFGGLLLVNLLGLNAWAWKLDSVLQAKQHSINTVLSQTFPGVRTIVDAPLQMRRQLDLLRQASGGAAEDDMESMLAALGAVLPPGTHAGAIDFAPGELSLKGLGLAGAALDAVRDKLQARGYRVRIDGERLIVRAPGSA